MSLETLISYGGTCPFLPLAINQSRLSDGASLKARFIIVATTDKEFCDPIFSNIRTRIEGSFEGRMNPEHHASTLKLIKDIAEADKAKTLMVGPSRNCAKQKAVCHSSCLVLLFVTTAWKSPNLNWGAFPGPLRKSRRWKG